MILKEINFNHVRQQGFIGLAIYQGNILIAEGSIGEVLKQIPHLADCEVIEQRPYFNEWVIEIV